MGPEYLDLEERMLQVQEIQVACLHPWEDNPRLNDHAVDAVAESMRLFGFNVPILCDQNLTIVAGHTRCKAAKRWETLTREKAVRLESPTD